MDLVHLRLPIINGLLILPSKLAEFNPKNLKIFYNMVKSKVNRSSPSGSSILGLVDVVIGKSALGVDGRHHGVEAGSLAGF